MKAWFMSLSLREKYMVQAASTVVLIFMFYLLIWQPISSSYERNKKNVANAVETIAWMKSAALQVKQLRGSGELGDHPQGKQFVLGMIDKTAKNAGLGGVLKRVQPEGETGVRVWFENAAFDELIKWLATLQSEHGLIVNEINVDKTESNGRVNVRVFLES